MMQLCVCKEGGRRNRGGNRSRSLGHQPAVEPATLPPTAPSSLILFLHPSTPFIPPVQCVTSLRTSRRSLQPANRLTFKFFKQCQLTSLIMPSPPATMFTVRCAGCCSSSLLTPRWLPSRATCFCEPTLLLTNIHILHMYLRKF